LMVDLRLGDCREVLRTLADESIDLTVTSPPYDNLRTYNGYTFDFEGIARELYRVTKPGGVVVWVVGDATVKGSETGTSFRQALFFRDMCGFNLHDTMIYDKGGAGGAKGSNSAYWNGFEYMFVLSKGAPKAFNPLQDRPNPSAGRTVTTTRRNTDGSTSNPRTVTVAEYGRRFNIWTIKDGKRQHEHPATFPESLARDHILSWSNPGDTVLDPFLGSGTTGKMVVQHGRKFVGIEISPEYLAIATNRIAGAQSLEAA
jgi:site-specific DNA-methyltransferase (adenine-specific)